MVTPGFRFSVSPKEERVRGESVGWRTTEWKRVPSQHIPQLEHKELLGSVEMEGTELRINKKPVLTIKGQHRLVDHFSTK